ncbi:MAG: hypothetical protein K6B74_11435 [Ruminococcus sp.]|nr:hypothetical protein [Ruminococcus sp.]
MKKLLARCFAAVMAAAVLSGCGKSFTPPPSETPLKPVADLYIENHYEGVAPTKQPATETFTSADGLCVIEKKESYYDVTLDLEKGSHYDVGKAYGETLLKACDDLGEDLEPYMFENIRNAFSELNGDYSGVKKRIDTLVEAIDPEYRDELEGFAEGVSGGRTGFTEDGVLSADEAKLVSLVPDVLRPTMCSAVSVDGSRTATGERLSVRLLDWDLGSDRQICRAHCVLRMKNGSRSFTAVTQIGVLSPLTAINDDGLMVSEFDVGSGSDTPYECEGRTSYSFDMRHCLENFTTAREAGEYVVERSKYYTWCVNVMLTDRNEALCAELVCTGNEEKDGCSLLRDGSTKLNPGVEWDDPNVLCIVNCFAADGNYDGLTGSEVNITRWKKYRKLFCTDEKLTVGRFKELLTCEKQNNIITNFRNAGTVHMVIADYSDDTLQAVFAGEKKNPDTPEFIDLGSWHGGTT